MERFPKLAWSAFRRPILEKGCLFLALVFFCALGWGVFPWLDGHQERLAAGGFTGLAVWISHWGDSFAFWLAGGYLFVLWKRAPRRVPVFLLLLAGQHVLSLVGKTVFHTTRPVLLHQVGGYAYPSGHTLMATCLYGYLAAHSPVGMGIFFCSMAGLVGWSRVALGHHWLRDVLGALLLGWIWTRCCIALSGKMHG